MLRLFIYRFHHTLGIVGIVDGKAAGVADLLCPAAQDAHAGGVEGGGEHFVPSSPPSIRRRRSFSSPAALLVKVMAITFQLRTALRRSIPSSQLGGIRTSHNGGTQGFDVLLGHRAGRFLRAVRRAEPDKVGDTVDQHGGLAAAGTGKDEQRAVRGKHSLPLHIVLRRL